MFTGIIEATGEVLQSGKGKLSVSRPGTFWDIKTGSSISVAGVCLTVTAVQGRKGREGSMSFDVVPETLRTTRLGNIRKGDLVNLERAMKSSARLDGHIVQGHVEGVGRIMTAPTPSPSPDGRGGRRASELLKVRLPKVLSTSVVPKGSIAIDGVSLTVVSTKGGVIILALVPYTMKHTTLGKLKKGDVVNIETDITLRSGNNKKNDVIPSGDEGRHRVHGSSPLTMTRLRIGIVHSSWHAKEVKALVASTVKALKQKGVPGKNVSLHEVAGSFEIPLIGAKLARTKSCDALIGIGIIVEGETHHAALLASSVAQGIMRVQVEYGVPFAFEVLYVDRLAVARRRLTKGKEAAEAVLHSLAKLGGMSS